MQRCVRIVPFVLLLLTSMVCSGGSILVDWGSHTSGEAWLPFWGSESVIEGRWLSYPLTRSFYLYDVSTGGLGCVGGELFCGLNSIRWHNDNPYSAHIIFDAYWAMFGATTVKYWIFADVIPTYSPAPGIPPDFIPPVTSAVVLADPGANPGWYWSLGAVQLDATDDGGAGLDAGSTLYHRPTDGTWTTYSSPVSFGAEGHYDLTYKSYDRAGNVEGDKTLSFGVDLNPPVVTGVSDLPYYYSWIYDAGKTGFRVTGNVSDSLAKLGELNLVINPDDLTNIDSFNLNVLPSGDFTLDFFPADATNASEAIFAWTDPSGHATLEDVIGIPEPGSAILLGSALAVLGLLRRKR
jgi:hypothetical protein